MKKCPNCQKLVREDSLFCSACGQAFKEEEKSFSQLTKNIMDNCKLSKKDYMKVLVLVVLVCAFVLFKSSPLKGNWVPEHSVDSSKSIEDHPFSLHINSSNRATLTQSLYGLSKSTPMEISFDLKKEGKKYRIDPQSLKLHSEWDKAAFCRDFDLTEGDYQVLLKDQIPEGLSLSHKTFLITLMHYLDFKKDAMVLDINYEDFIQLKTDFIVSDRATEYYESGYYYGFSSYQDMIESSQRILEDCRFTLDKDGQLLVGRKDSESALASLSKSK